MEVRECAGRGIRSAGLEARVETAGPQPGRAAPCGPLSRLKFAVEIWSGRRSFQGKKWRVDCVDRAVGRRRQEPAIRSEEVDVEVVERNLGQVFEVHRHLPGLRVRLTATDELRVHPEAVEDHEEAVLVAGLRFAEVERAGKRAPSRVGVPTLRVPILELSGQFAGPSEPKLACASVQAVCPSAASGLIVSPSGRVTIADLICEGETANPSNCCALQIKVEARGRVGLTGRQAGVEERFEGLPLAARRLPGSCFRHAEGLPGSW